MATPTQVFRRIASKYPGLTESKILCALAIKNESGIVIFLLWKHEMVFRLEGEARENALKVEGAKIFSPRGERRLIQTGIQLPFEKSEYWEIFAEAAHEQNRRLLPPPG